MKKRQTVFLIIVVVVLAIVGYFYYPSIQASPGIEGSKILFPRWFTREVTPTPTLLECVDSDGDDEYTKGNVWVYFPDSEAGYMTYWDECVSLDEVKEWVCQDDQAVALSFDCDFGCDDGACAFPPWVEEQKLKASDAYPGDHFGSALALSGDVAAVGAQDDYDLGAYSGSAYIYRFDGVGWNEEQKLLANDGAAGDKFGWSVSVSGDVVVVGMPYDDDGSSSSGSAYVFRFDGDTWIQEQKLHAPAGVATLNFGYSVSVYGDVIVVGDYGANDSGMYSGAAYVFRYDGFSWVQEQKLIASDGAKQDFFGASVSIDDDSILVGAYGDDDNGNSSGSAYLFRYNGLDWDEESKLTAFDGTTYDLFGSSVALSGDVAVIGAYKDSDNGVNSGSAYVFQRIGSDWASEGKLLASDGAADDYFGETVAVSGEVVVVGAALNDEVAPDSGAAYVYRFDGSSWIEEKLLASDAYVSDEFGNAVAVCDDLILVGSPGESSSFNEAGAAYIFRESED